MTAECAMAEFFIGRIRDNRYISSIPTHSSHEHRCREILNALLEEDPNSYPLINSFCEYPIQKWAEESRKSLELDLSALQDFLEERRDSYYGVVRYSDLSLQKKMLMNSEKMLRLTDRILSGKSECPLNNKELKTIRAIHGSESDDVSKHFIDNYYEESVKKVICSYKEVYRQLYEIIREEFSELEGDMQSAFHNSDYLVLIAPLISSDAGRVKGNQIDYSLVKNEIDACVSAVAGYPFNGMEIQKVLLLRAEGCSESECARRINKSRKYIHTRYEDGMRAISSLLWGYSSREYCSF